MEVQKERIRQFKSDVITCWTLKFSLPLTSSFRFYDTRVKQQFYFQKHDENVFNSINYPQKENMYSHKNYMGINLTVL